MKRSAPPRARKPVPKRNAKRAAKKFVRNFHSKKYRDHIASLPCAVCGVEGISDPAHLVPRGMGGCNGDASVLAPLCRDNPAIGRRGCHSIYDLHQFGGQITLTLKSYAAELWSAWQVQYQETE